MSRETRNRSAARLASGFVIALTVMIASTFIAADGGNQTTKPVKKANAAKHTASSESAASPEAMDRARKAIRAREFVSAQSIIDTALKATRSVSVKAAWRLIEAESEFAQEHFAKSGLIAMRIVISSPENPHVGEALYRAGRVYEKLGRPAKARDLYKECMRHATTSDELKASAQKRYDALEPKGEKK